MTNAFRKLGAWLAPAMVACSAGAVAQDKPANYPERPIRIIISVNPGAGADIVARMTAEILSERWGQNVVVEPRPGGGGVIASTYAVKAEPDGYTMLQNGYALLLQGATKRVPFNPLEEFIPVVRTTQQPYILSVQPRLPAKSIKELIEYSKSHRLSYAGSSGIGSTVHIGMEQFAKLSGIKLKHIPYKGSSAALRALMGSEINMAATSVMSAVGAAKTGKVRPIANLGSARVDVFPDLPTVAEQGYPGFEVANKYNLWAPKGTPKDVVLALNRVISEGMNSPKMKKRLAALGAEPVKPSSPDHILAALKKDYEEIKQSVKELGLKF